MASGQVAARSGSLQLGALTNLLALSPLIVQRNDRARILDLAASAAESCPGCTVTGIVLGGAWQEVGRRGCGAAAADVVRAAGRASGAAITLPGIGQARAYRIPGKHGSGGFLVVSTTGEAAAEDQRLLQAIAHHVGLALENARLHACEREQAAELRAANVALRRSLEIHDRLTQVALRGEGHDGLAQAIYELTGHPAGIEDPHGNVIAWAGPGRPDQRTEPPRRATQAAGLVRDGSRLLSVARLAGAAVAVLVLADPERTAGDAERVAVEHASVVLALGIARQRGLVESQVQSRTSLTLQLVTGGDHARAVSAAQAIGYDLARPHRAVVIEPPAYPLTEMGILFQAVSQVASAVQAGSLVAACQADVIMLADADPPWDDFHRLLATELRGAHCSVGVGGASTEICGVPQSYREAQLALRIQKAIGAGGQITRFDDLGVYQVLANETDVSAMESFAREWLGRLADYDSAHGAHLVITLSTYLDCGGSYEATATALAVHRSTLKYRLRRIREVSGYDLSVPETQFNLQLATRAWRTLRALKPD